MSKRTAENQLTQDNWEAEEDENNEVKNRPYAHLVCVSKLHTDINGGLSALPLSQSC